MMLVDLPVLAAHSRLTRIVAETGDDVLRERAQNLLDYYDNAIVAAYHEGRGDDRETQDDMLRFKAMANRLFRHVVRFQAGVIQ
jgi:hypothetical protein